MEILISSQPMGGWAELKKPRLARAENREQRPDCSSSSSSSFSCCCCCCWTKEGAVINGQSCSHITQLLSGRMHCPAHRCLVFKQHHTHPHVFSEDPSEEPSSWLRPLTALRLLLSSPLLNQLSCTVHSPLEGDAQCVARNIL